MKYRYVCLGQQLGAGYDASCTCTVSGRAIDGAVAKLVQELLDALAVDVSPRVRRQLVERSRQGGGREQASQRIERLRKQRQQIEKVLANASEKSALDEMWPEAYENLERVRLDETRAIDAAIEQIRPKTTVPVPLRLPAESLLASVAGWAEVFPNASPQVRRAMYGYLFEHITPLIHGRANYAARVKGDPCWLGPPELGGRAATTGHASGVRNDRFSTGRKDCRSDLPLGADGPGRRHAVRQPGARRPLNAAARTVRAC